MSQRSVSPKGGCRENHKVRFPIPMTEAQRDVWYAKVDRIRRGLIPAPPKRIFLPAARVMVELADVF